MDGWFKIHRKILENPIVCKDAEHIAIWIYLLSNATYTDFTAVFKGKKITLHPGQLITGRKVISDRFKINESKVQRILKSFENDQQIEQQTSNVNRLITILNWGKYQLIEQQNEQPVNNGFDIHSVQRNLKTSKIEQQIEQQTGNENRLITMSNSKKQQLSEQQIEQPVNNQRTTSEQPVNTNKNIRIKELKNKYTCGFESFWLVYPRKKDKGNAFKKYTARLNAGFTEDELLTAAKAYAEECRQNRTEEKYIKHPSTFLSDSTPFTEYLKGGISDDPRSNFKPDADGLIQQAVKAGIGDGEWEGF